MLTCTLRLINFIHQHAERTEKPQVPQRHSFSGFTDTNILRFKKKRKATKHKPGSCIKNTFPKLESVQFENVRCNVHQRIAITVSIQHGLAIRDAAVRGFEFTYMKYKLLSQSLQPKPVQEQEYFCCHRVTEQKNGSVLSLMSLEQISAGLLLCGNEVSFLLFLVPYAAIISAGKR